MDGIDRPGQDGGAADLTAGPARKWGAVLLVALATLLVFSPSLRNGFVNWDDDEYLVNNPNCHGLSAANVRWMFTTFHGAHYAPLSWLSYGTDYELWGLKPFGYHLTGVLLHALNAVLLYFLIAALLRIARPDMPASEPLIFRMACAAGALFFAIHPLRVESVAWAAERRDVLSGAFYLLTVLAYLKAAAAKTNGGAWMTASVLCFALGLLSKASGVMLPAVLLILDAYPLRRTGAAPRSWLRPVAEKIPFFLLSGAAAAVAVLASGHGGALEPLSRYGILYRAWLALGGLLFYLIKTVLPLMLSPLYLANDLTGCPVCLVLPIFLTVWLIKERNRWPWALAAWLCWVALLAPFLGFFQSGAQAAADRYTYLPSMALAALVAAGVFALWRDDQPTVSESGALAVIVPALLLLGALCAWQTGVWRNSVTLWNHALNLDAGNYIAYNNRGNAWREAGDRRAALDDYTSAIHFHPRYDTALNNRGNLREEDGDAAGAMADYTAALEANPRYAPAWFNRGNLNLKRGHTKAAAEDYTAALGLEPGNAEALLNRAAAREKLGDQAGAVEDMTRALDTAPADWPLRPAVEQALARLR